MKRAGAGRAARRCGLFVARGRRDRLAGALRYPDAPASRPGARGQGGRSSAARRSAEIARALGRARRSSITRAGSASTPTSAALAQKIRAGQYTLSSSHDAARSSSTSWSRACRVEEVAVTIPEGKNLLRGGRAPRRGGRVLASDERRAGDARPGASRSSSACPATRSRATSSPTPTASAPARRRPRCSTRWSSTRSEVLRRAEGARTRTALLQLQKNYSFDDREIVLMASLVEKETARSRRSGRASPACSSTGCACRRFVPHLLQTDPTIVYGCTVPLEKSRGVPEVRGAHPPHPPRRQGQPVQHLHARGAAAGADLATRAAPRSRR